jgi:hypothetical protein
MPEDMPEHMPEDMPNRMPEDMSDRMPEDLRVTKCVNVMVGITRSKVISSKWENHDTVLEFEVLSFSTSLCAGYLLSDNASMSYQLC